jgi:NADPH-dependent curcumin reductase CurA
VESKSDNFKVGDTVWETSHGRKYFLAKEGSSTKVDSSIPVDYLSILG